MAEAYDLSCEHCLKDTYFTPKEVELGEDEEYWYVDCKECGEKIYLYWDDWKEILLGM